MGSDWRPAETTISTLSSSLCTFLAHTLLQKAVLEITCIKILTSDSACKELNLRNEVKHCCFAYIIACNAYSSLQNNPVIWPVQRWGMRPRKNEQLVQVRVLAYPYPVLSPTPWSSYPGSKESQKRRNSVYFSGYSLASQQVAHCWLPAPESFRTKEAQALLAH